MIINKNRGYKLNKVDGVTKTNRKGRCNSVIDVISHIVIEGMKDVKNILKWVQRKVCGCRQYKETFAVATVVLVGALALSIVSYSFYKEGTTMASYKDTLAREEVWEACDDIVEEIAEKNIERVHAAYKFDVTKVENVVSDADYTYVARVEKVLGTVYRNPVKLEDTTVRMPYTKYRLKIVKSIKGSLKVGSYIDVLKAGGKRQGTSKYIVYDKDSMPVKGNTYIFSTYVQTDGSFLVTGANSSIKTNKNYSKSRSYTRAYNARKKKLTARRTRYKMNSRKVYVK